MTQNKMSKNLHPVGWHDDVKETVEMPVVADNMSEEECEACTI